MRCRNNIQLGATESAIDASARRLHPQTIVFSIVENERLIQQPALMAKRKSLTRDLPDIHDARSTQRSPSDKQWTTTDYILHHFVIVQIVDGICPALAGQFDPNDNLVIGHQPGGFGDGAVLGLRDATEKVAWADHAA
jgi:hypothetical protein